MVDDLQRRAERIGGRPRSTDLPRARRERSGRPARRTARNSPSALTNRRSGSFARRAERPSADPAHAGSSPSRRARAARARLRRPASAPGERIVEIVEKLELRLWRKSRVIGDIVGRAHEAIEGEDRTAPLLAESHEATGKFSSRWPLPGGPRSPSSCAPCLSHRRLESSFPVAAAPPPIL